MAPFTHIIAQFCRDEEAATAIEYGLIVGILSVALLAVIGITGDRIAAVFNFILADIDANAGAATSGGN